MNETEGRRLRVGMLYALQGLPLLQENRPLERKIYHMIIGYSFDRRLDAEDARWLVERFDVACIHFGLDVSARSVLWCSIFSCGRTFA